MLNTLTLAEAQERLRLEYSELAHRELEIVQRLDAGGGRLSNAFLVRAKPDNGSPGKLVAKFSAPTTDSSKGLIAEWKAIKIVNVCGSVPCPKLTVGAHEPIEFLLLDYLEGLDAQTCIDQGDSVASIFESIGRTLSKLHDTPAPHFGDLTGAAVDWPSLISTRIQPKLEALIGILDTNLHFSLTAKLEELLPSINSEATKPAMIHRNIYLSNFVIDSNLNQASIIDFGMACGGRPFYDLAKFYILDLYRYPEARESFLNSYFSTQTPPSNFQQLLTLYLYVELLGMIRFFNAVGQHAALKHAVTALEELTDGHGTIVDLIRH